MAFWAIISLTERLMKLIGGRFKWSSELARFEGLLNFFCQLLALFGWEAQLCLAHKRSDDVLDHLNLLFIVSR